MTHKEKISKFVISTGMSKAEFCRKCGLSIAYLDSKGSVTSDKLSAILKNFRSLNINWLLFDEGNMTIDTNNYAFENEGEYKLNRSKSTVLDDNKKIDPLKAYVTQIIDEVTKDKFRVLHEDVLVLFRRNMDEIEKRRKSLEEGDCG